MKIIKCYTTLALLIENKEEARKLYEKLNEEYHKYAPENAYDLCEIETLEFPIIITEDEVKEENYPYMWEDDFEEIMREHQSEIGKVKVGDVLEI